MKTDPVARFPDASNRRTFLKTSTLAGLGAALSRTSLSAQSETKIKSSPDVIVYEGTYPGWPWVTRSTDGTLHCVVREGTEHMYSATGRILLSQSTDEGRTWSPARVILDEPEVDDRNVAIAEIPGGNLLVSYNTYTKDAISAAMTCQSSDGGKSWEGPVPVGCPDSRTRAAVKALSNGDLVLPLYLDPGARAVASLSSDRGRTWTHHEIPNSEGCFGDEWDFLEMSPGKLVSLSRNNVPQSDGYFWQSKSEDRGRTWSPLVKTNVQSRRYPAPAQLFFQQGVATLLYPDRRMVSVSAVRSHDPELLEWDLENRFELYRYNPDQSAIPDGSYAVSAPIGARKRMVVDYEIREDSKRVAGYFVEFPEDWGKV